MERRVFLQDEIENIIHMYDNGCTQQTIADKYNTTQGTISSVIKVTINTLQTISERAKLFTLANLLLNPLISTQL